MIRAALYARVSTEMQEKEQTIQSQLAVIARYAEERAFHTTPAHTYLDEGYSGSYLDRPALDQLRDHAREGRFDAVIVLCPDRLARKYAYQVLLLEELKRAGIDVHFCERPITESPDDQLLLQIQGAIAEYERTKILERSRRGRLHRARMGEITWSSIPYGYRRAAKRDGGDGRVSIDEDEAALVRQVFEWYAEEGMTLYRLLGKLNASPWKTRAGRKEWTATTVLRMLHTEWYIGRAYYNRTRTTLNIRPAAEFPSKKVPKYTLTQRPKAEWIDVAVPPLVDVDLFHRVQRRLAENRRFARRRMKRDGIFLLKGLLKCGLCGHAYIGETRVDPPRNGREYAYHFYLCSMRMAHLSNGIRRRCPNDRLRVAGVNETVWVTVRDLLLNSDTLARELTAWVEKATATPVESDDRLKKAQNRLHELVRQRDRLTDAYQIAALSLDTFRARMSALEESRLLAETTVAELRAEHLEAEVLQHRAVGAQQLIDTLRPMLLGADFQTKQTILRLLVERVVITGHHLEIQLALPVSGDFGLTSAGQPCRTISRLACVTPASTSPI